MRVKITLACTECKQRNYDTKKNKKNDPDRLELKKYAVFAVSTPCIRRLSKNNALLKMCNYRLCTGSRCRCKKGTRYG